MARSAQAADSRIIKEMGAALFNDESACPYCLESPRFEVQGLYPDLRELDAIFCCEETREEFQHAMGSLDAGEYRDFWRGYFKAFDVGGTHKACGLDVRSMIPTTFTLGDVVDFNLTVRMLQGEGVKSIVTDFIGEHHVHNEPPTGWRFCLSCYNGPTLIGIATVGRPVAPRINPYYTCEVNRLCVRRDIAPHELTRNACSLLYTEAAREAERRGYRRAITYTLITEPGTSLVAAGWECEPATTREGQIWSVPSRERRRTEKEEQCSSLKWRWTRYLRPPKAAAEALALKAEAARIRKAAECGQYSLWGEAGVGLPIAA